MTRLHRAGTLITVTTAAEQSAYAAAIPLHPAGEAQGVMLKLRMLVTRGEIGVRDSCE